MTRYATMTATIFGERYSVVWTGTVWQRDDNGQRSARPRALLADMIRDSIIASGDDPDDFADEIDDAVTAAS